MSTQKKDVQSGQFDPSAMQTYQGLMPGFGQQVGSFMNNPYGNQQFQQESQMGTRQAGLLGQRGMSNLMQNQTASGFGGNVSSPFMQEMQANQGRANTGLQSQLGFMNPTMMANQRQQSAMGMAGQFRPLQTGQTNVESTSGLGTWLPQMLGAGLGLAMGNPGALGGMFGGGHGGGGGMPQSPFGSQGNIGMSGVPSAGWGGGGMPQWGSPMSGFGAPQPPMPPWMQGGGM